MLSLKQYVLAPVATVSLLTLAACAIDLEPVGPTRTETRSIDLDKSELARVLLKMGAGEMHVRGGSPKLMEAEFTFNRPNLKPDVHYDASGFRSNLVIEEPSNVHHGGNSKYRWDVRLNDDKPVDLEVHFGAGEGRLDLGSLTLRSLEVHMGVGELRVDLRGTPKNSYDVSIHGGVGEVTVYLPEGVGVVADAKGGIGGISARGLQKRDGQYVNDAYGHAKTTVRLDIRGGVGSINLVGG
ncbi:MAG TPA: toast rack family protein [Bryobacteraceae bacterium]|nr:toast rack family protein [Bryobacteraceae bacterium]